MQSYNTRIKHITLTYKPLVINLLISTLLIVISIEPLHKYNPVAYLIEHLPIVKALVALYIGVFLIFIGVSATALFVRPTSSCSDYKQEWINVVVSCVSISTILILSVISHYSLAQVS